MLELNKKATVDPYQRWMYAHHLFFVLIQGLIIAHRDLLKALKTSNLSEAVAAFNLATNLFWGSTGAFRFGTDYSPEEYEKVVRPTMGPPDFSPGFSDLQSVDHTALLSLIAKLNPYFKNLPDELKPAYQGYISALHAVYENHAFVCERFVGKKGESLLQKSQSDEESVSAADSIRTIYKKRTLKYAGIDSCPMKRK